MDATALHVLLVEDDDAHAMMVEKSFRKAHQQGRIDRVRDGVEALDYLNQQGEYTDRPRPALILLDLNMPRLDGHGVLKKLKSNKELKIIPVVILTTSNAERDALEAYRLNANSYLVKPTNFAKFRELIEAVIAYWGNWNRKPE